MPRPIDSATCPVAYERYERMPVGLHASHGSAAQHSQGDAATPEISWVFPLRPSFSQGQSNGPTLQHPLASAARTDALEGRLKGPLETPGMARSKIKIYKRAKSRAKSFLTLLSSQPISRNFSRFITPRSGVQVSPEPLFAWFVRYLNAPYEGGGIAIGSILDVIPQASDSDISTGSACDTPSPHSPRWFELWLSPCP